MTENTPHRYQVLAEALHITVNKLETEIGAPSSTMQSAVRRGSEVGGEMAKRILKRYPQVSAEWLITGEGSIFKQQANTGISTTSAHEHDAHYGPITPLRTMTEEEKLALYQTGDWDATRKMVAERLVNGNLTDLLTELFLQRGMGA